MNGMKAQHPSSILMLKRKRALEACDSCRKQKTRCLAGPPDDEDRTCLRCRSLQLECSLAKFNQTLRKPDGDALESSAAVILNVNLEKRLKVLEKAVSSLSTSALHARPTYPSEDIYLNGILSLDEIELLLDIFIERYGKRWLSLDCTGAEYLEFLYRKSHLLLVTACVIALRHNPSLKARVYSQLLDIVDLLVSQELLTASPSLQFFEAVSILSLYQPLRYVQKQDLWLLSGFALRHRILSSTQGWFNGFVGSRSTLTYLDIVPARTWNHLCHAHLLMCIGYRRHAMLEEPTFDECRNILTNCQASEFDGNILGMLSVYSMLYRLLRSSFDLDYAIFQLEEWRKEWCHLWEQPEPVYSQVAYFYAYNVVYEVGIQMTSDTKHLANIAEYVGMLETYALKTVNAIFELSAYDMSRCSDHVLFHAAFACASMLRLMYAAKTKDIGSLAVQTELLNEVVTKTWKWLLLISVDQYHFATKFATYLKEYQSTVNEADPDTFLSSAKSGSSIVPSSSDPTSTPSTWYRGPPRAVSDATLQGIKPYNLGVATVEHG
ncbi:DNA-binding transcription factor, zf-fungal binuclear cluster type [Schizosaccharomyces osmophilus]|uniref:DNA-binding transcription factor, zf-fungal binuclear cluster type n=1 Tax=Schizosaccharomyces osmophilus TaxID=2545709 RepID=A0AAE9WDY3_9SCHI|nr:DNA-binding transcription factor, zf-fungal binuclear cluster type [Schizosaccharomyces osmophilus]WBW72938.1 DNA-binding transcription factor, zf-fungal binuclear cluster type [Schizosaccharomyces osmophilus]